MIRRTASISAFALLLTAFAAFSTQSGYAQGGQTDSAGQQGQRLSTVKATEESTESIMQRQAAAPPAGPRPEHELEYPDRSNLPQNPGAAEVSSFPETTKTSLVHTSRNIHTTANSFNGATLTDTGAFPPDSMGTVGPTQFIVFVNGRIRSFTKAGVADGVINADPDVFFASVTTPVTGSVVLDFTSDPQIRYDRFSGRWFMSIIDVPCTNATCSATAANRWLLAVSDAASNGTITNTTVWKFFFFQADPGTNFCDYPSLGIDVNALYVGCNMFSSAGAFNGTNGYVIQKASTLGAGPLVVTMFANLAAGAGAGPESPRGVDNFDSTATEGYFVGPDNASFNTIMFRRVTNPGSLTPTISANISVSLAPLTTTLPNRVEHAGNTGGANGGLDSLDDRFFQAMVRNGRLWTAHNFRVNAAGAANTAAAARNAARWYEFQNLTTTPTLVQAGTVYDSAATRAAALQYWIPSVTVTGQGHAVLGFTMAGTPSGATPAYVGRLAGDTLGTMTAPPTTGAVTFGTTTANYNPPSDPGGANGRRWGDYSFTVVDPLDDMSVWTIQEYNQALNSYAVRVGRLLAPPPATPTCTATPVNFSGPTGNVVINATSTAGSGFYDPGTNLPAPARPFSHLTATVTNATVNSVTYNSPTQVTLNITSVTGGLQNVTLTNPDGQSVTANNCINVVTHTVTPSVTGNGTITPNTPQIVANGTQPAFTVAAGTGSHLVNVTGTCGGSLAGNVYTTNAVTVDCTVIANFALDQFTLTYLSDANGSITGTTPQTVNFGANGTPVTAVPNTGYHFVQWSDASTANPRTDTNVTANITVTATFAINTYTLTYTAGANGSITGTSPQTVNYGASGSAVTAVADPGYHFVQWSDSSTANPRTDTNVTANLSVTATFAINTYTLTYAAGPNGSISGTSPQTVNFGASGTAVTAVADPGYHFVQWSDSSTANPRTDTNVMANVSVTATFAANPATQLVFTAQPSSVIAAGTTSATVSVEDAGGVVVTGDNTTQVSISVNACGTTPLGTVTVTAGVAQFTNLRFITVATGLQLHAVSSPVLNSADSTSFDVLVNSDKIFWDGFDGCVP